MSAREIVAAVPVLIVTTAALGDDLVAPSMRGLHLCQAWRPTTCWCDRQHAASDPSDVTVFVGPPRPALQASPSAIAIAVTPTAADVTPLSYARLTATGTQPFGPFVTAALHNLLDGLFVTGCIGYELAHLRKMLSGNPRFELAHAEGHGGLVEVGRSVVDAVTRVCPQRLHVGLRITSATTLFEINDIFEQLTSTASDESLCLYHATDGDKVSVSALFSP